MDLRTGGDHTDFGLVLTVPRYMLNLARSADAASCPRPPPKPHIPEPTFASPIAQAVPQAVPQAAPQAALEYATARVKRQKDALQNAREKEMHGGTCGVRGGKVITGVSTAGNQHEPLRLATVAISATLKNESSRYGTPSAPRLTARERQS
jgi:hypothetical protein